MTPARLLAPAALVAAAVALFVVVSSGSEPETSEPSAKPAATATATATREPRREEDSAGGTYTVKPGDTPSGIAEQEDVDLDALLEANPDIDPDALTVGEELKLP